MTDHTTRSADRNDWRVRGRRRVADPGTAESWTVSEVDLRGLPGAGDRVCLLFDGPSGARRVWRYPADWARLADAALLALRWTQ